jgi:hypothetical protein
LKRFNNNISLANETHFPVNKPRKNFSVRRLVEVIQLTGNSDNLHSTAVAAAAAAVLEIRLLVLYSVFGIKPGAL